MHELSIVEALIEQVQRELQRAGQTGRVRRLELSIGRLSGINCESVRFAFGLLAPDTLVADAEVAIQEPKARCCCRACNAQTELEDLTARCPKCGSDEITIEGGRELLLQTIELED